MSILAVVTSGNKQFLVREGSVIKSEKIQGKAGEIVSLESLFIAKEGSSEHEKNTNRVKALILEQKKDDKVIVFKKKRRTTYKRKKGHRQQVTILRIKEII